jgi:negative regulator of sigma E activity
VRSASRLRKQPARLLVALALIALSATAVRAASRAATASPRPPTVAGNDARPLIVQAVAAPRHVSFVGQMSSIRSGTTQATATIQKIEHRAPDQTRRTFLAPRDLYGRFVISRGAMSWDVNPRLKQVVITENKASVDPVAVVDDIALLDSNYRAVRTAADDVADRHADVVDLVSRYTGIRAMRVWLDVDTHVVLAKEAYHSDGSLAWRTRFDDIRYTDAIPQQVFSEATPAGFQTVRGRTYDQPQALPSTVPDPGFRPVTPKYLPEGFSLVGAGISVDKGIKNLHLIYSDGIRTLSLFQNATGSATDFSGMQAHATAFEGHDARYMHDGPTTLLAWREHKLTFALVGDLDLKELTQIATSIIP